MEQACDASDERKITIVTGHTGTYNDLFIVVGVCTGYGHVNKDRLLTPAGAQARDHIVCVKPAGLETVVNFAVARGHWLKSYLV